MQELLTQTLWGAPLVLLPSAMLMAMLVAYRVSVTAAAPAGEGRLRRLSLLRFAMRAACMAVASASIAAILSALAIVFSFGGLYAQLGVQFFATAGLVVAAAVVSVEVSAFVESEAV